MFQSCDEISFEVAELTPRHRDLGSEDQQCSMILYTNL